MSYTLPTRVLSLLRDLAVGALLSRRPAVLADERLVTELTPSRPADAPIVQTLAAWRDEVQR